MLRPYRALVGFLPRLWSNSITLLGAIITSATGLTLLAALVVDLTTARLNPYASAVLFLVGPLLFALGLALIPLGLVRERRRARVPGGKAVESDSALAAFMNAMQSATVRRRVGVFVLMSFVNVLLFTTVTFHSVTFMETPRFCGGTCHSVMQPEYDVYATSPHSRVACVECHIGGGAESFVAAKLNGLHQVWGVATGRFHRPIETPVHNLRPAGETCGSCHQAKRWTGTRLGFRVRFKPDAESTPQVSALLFQVGGQDPRTGAWSGIHWHASPDHQVRYEVLDDKRNVVGKIQKVEHGQVVAEWLPPVAEGGAASGGRVPAPRGARELRTMDCTDCHNRTGHGYDGTVDEALRAALVDGRLDRKVPWIYQVAGRVLADARPPRAEADAYFRQALADGYARDHAAETPAAAALDAVAAALGGLYRRNVYPGLNLGFDTYPSQIGHGGPDPGNSKAQCFRCHAGDRKTASGQELSGKCELCHEVTLKDELLADVPDEIRPLLHL
jgi:hypothetical protein